MHLPARDDAYLDRLAGALRDAGVTVACFPIDVGNISALDPAHRADDLREVEGWIDVAARLGSPRARVNANGAPPFAHEPIAPLEATTDQYLACYHGGVLDGFYSELLTGRHSTLGWAGFQPTNVRSWMADELEPDGAREKALATDPDRRLVAPEAAAQPAGEHQSAQRRRGRWRLNHPVPARRRQPPRNRSCRRSCR